MAVSYKRLWKLLIDKDMKKSDLEREAGISHPPYICGTGNRNTRI